VIDPFVYTLVSLLAGLAIGFGGFWFAGGFAPTRKREPPVAAE